MGEKGKMIAITGTGSYLPAKVLTNDDLSKMVDTTNEWILTRTGISERRIAAKDEAASDMGAAAAERAIKSAGLQASEVELIIVATITPDMVFPNTACFVQKKIGATGAFCFDIEAACSGFLYAMETARHMISGGLVKNALVIGAEKLSTITDWTDRATCVLFGDGAGAVILQAVEGSNGIKSSSMGSDGELAELLMMPGGGSRHPASRETVDARLHFMKMTGREVFKHAVRCMTDASLKALEKSGVRLEDISCIIPHQANMRIIQAIAERMGVSLDKFFLNLRLK